MNVSRILLALVILVAACAGCAKKAEPPQVSLASLDPALASLITTSRTAVIAQPKSAKAWGTLGQALNAAEFHSQAILCYSNASRLDPFDPRWPYLLGILDLVENPTRALDELRRAIDLTAGRTDGPRLTFARALMERGLMEEARQQLSLLVVVRPDHAAAHLEIARIHAAQNRLKEATAEIQWALTNQYTRRQALLVASQIAQRNGQADVAARLSQSALAMPRGFDWPDLYLKEVQNLRANRARLAEQVNAFIQQQRFPEADAALTSLLSSFPDDLEGLLLLGRLRYVQKRCPEAEAAYRRHLALKPDSVNGFVQLGIAQLCQQQWTNAAASFRSAISLKPDFTAAYHNLGVALSRSGDGLGAIQAYRDALRCTPGDVNALFALAEELANANQLPEAIECVKRAETLSPNDPRLQRAREQLNIK